MDVIKRAISCRWPYVRPCSYRTRPHNIFIREKQKNAAIQFIRQLVHEAPIVEIGPVTVVTGL